MLTPGERRLIEDANAQVEESTRRFAELQFTSGIRPPPVVESSESSSELERFNFSLKGSDESMAEDQSSPPCPPCPPTTCEVTLSCDSVTASRSKCGFPEFVPFVSTPPHFYLARSWHLSGSCSCGGPDCVSSLDLTSIQIYTPEGDGSCTFNESCSGTSVCGSQTSTFQSASCPPFVTFPDTGCFLCFGGGGECTCGSTCQYPYCPYGAISPTQAIGSCTWPNAPPAPDCTSQSKTVDLSNEYTTDQLKANTEAALPAYSGYFECVSPCDPDTPVPPCFQPGQGCDCQALTFLSDDESEFDIENFKPRFTLTGGVLASNATVNYNEHFVADAGGESFTPASTIILAGNDSAVGPEVVHPSENGYIEITEISCELD